MNIFRILGFVFLGIALLGVFLPLLPTTPFVLVATTCFARSSEKWHQWMLRNEVFGPMILDWEKNRCVSLRVKLIAITSMLMVGGSSIYFAVETTRNQALSGLLILIGLVTVSLLKTCKK